MIFIDTCGKPRKNLIAALAVQHDEFLELPGFAGAQLQILAVHNDLDVIVSEAEFGLEAPAACKSHQNPVDLRRRKQHAVIGRIGVRRKLTFLQMEKLLVVAIVADHVRLGQRTRVLCQPRS